MFVGEMVTSFGLHCTLILIFQLIPLKLHTYLIFSPGRRLSLFVLVLISRRFLLTKSRPEHDLNGLRRSFVTVSGRCPSTASGLVYV